MNSTVYTNMDSVRNYNIFTANQSKASNAMSRATTGLRIASVQDGPADWAISERMRERINSLTQANQNTQNANSMMKTAESGITNIVSILRTLKEKAIEAADSTASVEDRKALQKETENLLSQIDDIAYGTKFNGTNLLVASDAVFSDDITGTSFYEVSSTTSTDTESITDSLTGTGAADNTRVFQVGDDPNLKIKVDLPLMSLKGLGLMNPLSAQAATALGNLSTAVASAEKASAIASNSDQLDTRDANYTLAKNQVIDLNTRGNALTAMKAIERALNTALEAGTNIGSIENRLGYTADNLSTQIENLQSSDSTIRDANMAKEISDYMKWSVLMQSSQYMLAQSNQNAFSVLNLLQ